MDKPLQAPSGTAPTSEANRPPPVFTHQAQDPAELELTWLQSRGREALRLGYVPLVLVVSLAVGFLSSGVGALLVQIFAPLDRVPLADVASVLSPVLWWVGVLSALLTALGFGAWLSVVSTLHDSVQTQRLLRDSDAVTGVRNRRAFMDLTEGEWARARRYGQEAALLLVDADYFMALNDRHGHRCGDQLLRHLAGAAQLCLRQSDVLGRFGGAQFAIFLPSTDLHGALDVAERIRVQSKALCMNWQGKGVQTTVSVGVAPLRPDLPTLDWMVHEVETALMAAKADGRNRVRTLAFEHGHFNENQGLKAI
jgi:diguanylate cyclase (GGDEF)-like protein